MTKQSPIEVLERAICVAEECTLSEYDCADAREALRQVEAALSRLREMPCWSPYEGTYFTGCDNRIPPRMEHTSENLGADDEKCRRCAALAEFQVQP